MKAKVVSHTKENSGRYMPDVASKFLKEWGKSLAASEAVPDNHDKNSVSTTGEKIN